MANRSKKGLRLAIGLGLLLAFIAGSGLWWYSHYKSTAMPGEMKPLLQVSSVSQIKEAYDVIVTGTDPEGVAAAVSAARNGLSVLLVDGRNREILGGLMTLGWLNSLDNNYSPESSLVPGKHNFLNKGIFQEWYDRIEGTSFDVVTAANAFYELVRQEPNIDLLMKVKMMEPIVTVGQDGMRKVTGVQVIRQDGSRHNVKAKAVIDATQDADIAAAAGVAFTIGREDIGDPKSQMAVTLVFKLRGVTQEVWESFGRHKDTGIDRMSGWGFPEMWEYPSSNKDKVRMRGLNIGRQNDGTILINALQIFGINPLDPGSVEEAFEIGKKEIPLVVDYMKKNFKEFADLELAGTAPELYVRETRHMKGIYRLTITDVLDNRDQWDRIAFGSYKVDIQSTNYQDRGAIMLNPVQYAIPFRSILPREVNGLLVVGRSASFDTLPHGSARVIPVGMATGQAAGAAAKLAVDKGLSFRELSESKQDIAALQERLNKQGMELKPLRIQPPAYTKHKAYAGLKAAVSMNLTVGGDKNQGFDLDGASNAQRFVYQLNGVGRLHSAYFKGRAADSLQGMSNPAEAPLTLEQAAAALGSAMGLPQNPRTTVQELLDRGVVKKDTVSAIQDPKRLTNGEAYMLIRDVVANYAGKTYD
ncbi:FAD-dependent oxidoreductase [Paenibacillus elgii]|uniref:FAD-dependent oxidoreductase n=1 Tax=Paenibacillus elgii TaxID=189691 RepID=UPI003F7CDF64